MGQINVAKPVQLFCGAIYAAAVPVERIRAALEGAFGPADFVSGEIPFDFTDYYEDEMGPGLTKWFAAFEGLVSPEYIVDAKIKTNRIEDEFAREFGTADVRRPVNLDPGFVDAARISLATTKDFFHRVYIGRGIYAEVTMFYKDKTFNALPWTYPDYMSPKYMEYFLELRGRFMKKRNGSG